MKRTMTTKANEAGTAEFKAPHVDLMMLEILKVFSVDKDGQLPSNMGGKEYVSAPALFKNAKAEFTKRDLIVYPNERYIEYATVPRGDRAPTIVVAVEGTYQIVSTVDGSSRVISGTGDGMGQGNSVASNIASTNALKNAMLRVFLGAESGLEADAKGDNEPARPEKPESRAVATAKGGATQKREAPQAVIDLQEEVKREWAQRYPENMDGYVALGTSKYGEPAEWATNITKLKGLVKAIVAGE
jgi:hypothetical protein